MKLLLLHGAAINSSRNFALEIKKKFDPENVVVFEKGADPKNILDTLAATPLFNESKLVLIENPPEDFNYTLYPNPCTLILWFDHEVDTKKYRGFEVLYFPESKEVSVFPFLDCLGNKDQKAFLELHKLKKAGFDIQYAITMIFYLLRSLVSAPKKAPDFVKKKLVKQRARFRPVDVKNLYKDILEIDFKFKNGLIEQKEAEFFIVNKFLI